MSDFADERRQYETSLAEIKLQVRKLSQVVLWLIAQGLVSQLKWLSMNLFQIENSAAQLTTVTAEKEEVEKTLSAKVTNVTSFLSLID